MTRPHAELTEQQAAYLAFLDRRIAEKHKLMSRYLCETNLRPILKAELSELELARSVFVEVFALRGHDIQRR